MKWLCSLVALLALACGGDDGPVGRADSGGDAGVDSGDDTGTDAGSGDAGSDAAAVDVGVDAGVEIVRFFVLGDVGEGNTSQHEVAAVMKTLCDTEGCDFAVLLGDNIYDSGVDSVTDPQWETKFEEPYRELTIPFYAVLGNHDYGGTLLGRDTGGLGNEWDRGPIEVAYTDSSDKWVMLDTHYTFRWGPVGFIMLDTNSILWDDDRHGDQAAWFATAEAEVAGSEWVFGAGHHPYLSEGKHGNAGRYESIEVAGVEIPLPIPIMDGRKVKSFMEDRVCGRVDIYFAGHDHNRQWLNESASCGGTELIVSGAGAKTTDFVGRGNDLFFGDDTEEGVLYVIVEGNTLTGRFYDRTGAMNYERVLVH